MHVVSVSRRTDVSAFYSKWFMNRICAGDCEWLNPFGGQVYSVSLKPEDVLGLVFWTRFGTPMLPHLKDLRSRGFRFYFHVTLTGYGPPLELHNPPVEKALDAFRALSDAVSPELALWRYDPIVLSDAMSPDWHARQFERIARELAGRTRRCYVSFLDNYGKTRRNLARIQDVRFVDPEDAEKLNLARRLSTIAAAHGITIYACCEDGAVGDGVEKARCVDLELLRVAEPQLKRKPTRAECGCIESVDIGAYDTCRFGCAYCYATNSPAAADRRASGHDPDDSMLWRPERSRG